MTKVAILVFDGCAGFSLGAMTGTMLLANKMNAKQAMPLPPLQWKTVAGRGGAVRTGGGITVLSDAAAGAELFDLVCIPVVDYVSGADFQRFLDETRSLHGWLRLQWGSGATLAAFGTATFLLGEAELLDGRKATTVQWMANRFRQRYPRVEVLENQLITEADRLLCGAERTSHRQLLFRLVQLFLGPEVATRTARAIQRDVGRSGAWPAVPLFGNPDYRSPLIAKVNDWLIHNLHDEPSVSRLAAAVGMSVRTLDRHFNKDLGSSAAAYVREHRMNSAQQLLKNSNMSVVEVAKAVGYGDASSFARIFQKHFRMSPAEVRARPKA